MALALVLNRRRQVPAEDSPAFGAIAERFRRAGELERAVALCQEGLRKYPRHLSSRVTLGWALLDLGRYDEARVELEQVLKRAPDNLAAIRGLAQLHDRTEHDDVASMSSAPSRWQAPDTPAFADDEAVAIQMEESIEAPAADPHPITFDADPHAVTLDAHSHAVTLDANPGPWIGLDEELPPPAPVFAAPSQESAGPRAFFEETSEADRLAAQLLASGPPPVEQIADETRWTGAAPAPAMALDASDLAAFEVDDDRPWCDDGLNVGTPAPVQAAQPIMGLVPPGQPAVPYDEYVPDDGPGPWPPVFDDEPAAGHEPLRLAHSNQERDQWPPFDTRAAVRAVPAQPPPAQAEAAPLPPTDETPQKAGLLSALSKFRRRVDSRRRAAVSEYVAG